MLVFRVGVSRLTHQIGAIPMRLLRPVGRPATSPNSKAKIPPLNLRNSGVDLGPKKDKRLRFSISKKEETLALRSEICAISTRSFFTGVSRFRIWNRVRRRTNGSQHDGAFLTIPTRGWRCACGGRGAGHPTFQTPVPLGLARVLASSSNPTVFDKKRALPSHIAILYSWLSLPLSGVSVENAGCPFRILNGGGNAFCPYT